MNSDKITFTGALGEPLAARLDALPGDIRAYALFAHCFTCSKDIFAAARIASALAERGIAVLRFDFTGLGASGGDFANTNFSSNVGDLIAAAGWLRENRQAPSLLIGHSLGGAAVLAAAPQIEEAKAVATIGAPADPEHVAHNFAPARAEIEAAGEAEVTLAGRQFRIKKQFLEDIASTKLEAAIGSMRKALLVFHGPRDEIVGIDNASKIFLAAKHPKSFISLDDGDHLLTRRADAVYVAEVLAAWASRYLGEADEAEIPSAAPAEHGLVVVEETRQGKFTNKVSAGSHVVVMDEPTSVGGLDSGMNPYDLLLAALGGCTSMTLRMYAERKKLPLDKVAVRLTHQKIHASDCAECESTEGKVDLIDRELEITGDLDADQRQRLLEIADMCPVHRTLESENRIVTKLRA
ncbi:MAG: bifunctional alpha/beta hydrolase/OsmC family protein [Alphaproteobacteria bacterium]|nr:bifunctional alpha/beta hydrolase/OsmC family protein [Alphaproteobacteria bacterium]